MELGKKLSSLIKDIDRSFWNGNGTITFKGDLAGLLAEMPGMTMSDLRTDVNPSYVECGIGFASSTPEGITLGEGRGEDQGFSVSFGGELGLWIRFFLTQDGLSNLDDEDGLRRILETYTTLSAPGAGALVVLDFLGKINSGLSGTPNFGSVATNLNIGAGAAYRWSYCRPASGAEAVLSVVSETLSNARLPQTDLGQLVEAGKVVTMDSNEVLHARHLGFFTLGLSAAWGYEFNGSADYSPGAMDLSTRLTIAASTKLHLGYSLTGAFSTVVMKGTNKDFLRVVLDKDRSSNFEFGLGVKVCVEFDTGGLPNKDEGGLALFESILGTSTPKVLKDALELADLSPDELKGKSNGFLQAVFREWMGTAFDEIGPAFENVLSKLRSIQKEIGSIDDRILSVYENHLGEPLTEFTENTEGLFDSASQFSGGDLVNRVVKSEHQQLLEQLTGHSFSELFIALEQRRDAILAEALKPLQEFTRLVTSSVEKEVRAFVEAKRKALGIRSMMDELAAFDTVEKLEAEATGHIQELVGRLFDQGWDQLVREGTLADVFDDAQQLAIDFQSTLNRLRESRPEGARGREPV